MEKLLNFKYNTYNRQAGLVRTDYVCVSDYGCGEFLDELEDEPEYDQGEGVIMT